ncbi:hypothetical protein [Pseudomonas fluorescens]|uniref:hypothetical protein n=1 Tax=Pseudomonas fluorescens TaxID=294 RepID=UPI001242F100|nr:hypothetical protein [Pseudomonas fluorescens]
MKTTWCIETLGVMAVGYLNPHPGVQQVFPESRETVVALMKVANPRKFWENPASGAIQGYRINESEQ